MSHAFAQTIAIAVAALALSAHPRTQTAGDAQALQQFDRRITGYVTLKHQLQQTLPPLAVSPSADQICAAVDALAGAIRTARSTAREGDLFVADVRPLFRGRIEQALRDNHYPVQMFLQALAEDIEPGMRVPRLAVNDRFPWELGAATPPFVLLALPALPQGLQYRFIGRDLLLVDIDANLVLDILRESLPHTSFETGR